MPVRLLQLSPEDGKLTDLHSKLTVTSHDTDLASAENEEVIFGVNNKDRDHSWTYLPDCLNAVKCMCIFGVIPSGVICVLKLCYMLSHSDDMHMQLLPAHATALWPMHIQHLHVLAQARPTMSCIPLVVKVTGTL